ncbi:MAG: dihydrodipicolinate synthase family protein [Desulfobacteraceae bacterium]|nr:MAG: dihydrodipicolinate synthase family protein [Desulfobacteraceae bacterium]
MEVLGPPRGLIVDLITPLRNDGSIDGRGLGRLLDQLSPLAHALFLASPNTGEGKNMSLAQRLELLEKALVVIRGRIPILFWITRDTEEKTAEILLALKKVAERRRYEGQVFWVDTPLYYHSNRGLPALYQNLSSMVNEPFILHNDPKLIKSLAKPIKRCNIRTGILKELVSLKCIVGLIFLGSLDRAHNYQRACRSRVGFRIYDGDETNFLDYPSMSGVVSLGANLAPVAWRKTTESSLRITADRDNYPNYLYNVWELGQYLRNLKAIYQSIPPAIVKGILSDKGIIETPICTFPSVDVEESKRRIKKLMARYADSP